MKKQVLLLFAALLFSQAAFAYDFSAVTPSGQTLYYNIQSGSTFVEVVTPASSGWGSYTKPTGNLVIPNNVTYSGTTYQVTSIGQFAFRECSGLDTVTIPNSVTSIGQYAFYDCGYLMNVGGPTSVTIPNSVTSIGQGAFYHCSSLTSVTIGNSVTSIGGSAFSDCSGLTEVHYTGTIAQWCGITFGGYHSNPLEYANHLYINNSEVTSVSIPNTVTQIKPYTFYGWSGLTSLTIPNSVTSIGQYAFDGCSGLTSLTIPNSVTNIGQYAFSGCSGLTSLTIPNSVTSIADNTFNGCSGLTSVTIPNSVTSIGQYAFYGCNSLASVNIGNSVSSIGARAFGSCSGLTSVTIGNSVTSIGNDAFYPCSGLTSVTFNAVSCTSAGGTINHPVFRDCSNITSFTFGNNVRVIPPYLCSGLSGLISVSIPDSVSTIGEGAFYGCSGLTSVTFNANYCTSAGSSNSSPYSYAFGYCPNITSFTFGNNVRTIPSYLCYGLSGLTSVTISNSVTSIRNSAFEDCSGLTSVTIGNSVTSIGRDAFKHCYGLTAVHYNGTIGQWCSIGFSTLGLEITSNPLYFAHHLYINNVEVTSVSIPNTLIQIKPYTFHGCSGLTSVTIPNSVNIIGDGAFSGCSGLTSVTIPNSVNFINAYAFSGCSGLTSMTFLSTTPPQLGNNVFSNNVPSNIPVYIPCGSLANYVSQLPYFTNYIEIEQQFEFSAVSADENMGTVQVLTEPSCSNPNAVLNAVPANGYRFDHWSTGSTDNPYTLTVTNGTVIVAYFEEIPTPTYTVTVSADNPASGSVTGGGVFEEGTTITITATPANGYRFDHWSTGSTANPYTLTVTSNMTIIGYFVANGSQGIDEVVEGDIHISVSDGHINVEGVAEKEVQVYDITGRMVQNRSLPSGVYIVKIGTLAAHKVVVMR